MTVRKRILDSHTYFEVWITYLVFSFLDAHFFIVAQGGKYFLSLHIFQEIFMKQLS